MKEANATPTDRLIEALRNLVTAGKVLNQHRVTIAVACLEEDVIPALKESSTLRAERDALHRALNNLMALVHRDCREYNAWDACIRALVPGHRDELGVTVAFADEVERALATFGDEPA